MYLSVKNLATRINKHPRHIRHLIINGMFPNTIKNSKGAYMIPESDVLSYENSFKPPFQEQSRKYLTSSEVAEILSCSVSHISYLVKTGKFPNAYKQPNNKYRIPENDVKIIKEYLSSDELLSVNQAIPILQISKATLWKWLNEGVFPNAFKFKEWRIPKKDINSFFNTPRSSIEEIIPMTVITEFKNRISKFDFSRFKKTSELYQEFFIYSISTSRASGEMLWRDTIRHIKTLSYLINNLPNEIFLMNDKQLEKFIKYSNLPFIHKSNFTHFINYCSSRIECNFSKTYTISHKKKKVDQEIYDLNTFHRYYEYVKDIELHIKNALQNRIYTQTWLFVLMHMINAWRPSDIIKNLVSVNIEIIGISTLDFFDTGRLSLSQAQKIINQIYNKIEKLYISKTGALGQFLCNQDMIIPTATVFVLTELHRRINRDEFLLQSFIGPKTIKSLDKKYIEQFFKYDSELNSFQSRKMSRSLLTHYFDYIVKFGENSNLAYEMTRKMRNHVDKNKDSTAIYIQSINKDGSLDKVSPNLFKRGHFGWLYNNIIGIILTKENAEKHTLECKTAMIQSLEGEYTPIQLEGISHFLIRQQQEKEAIALKLATLPEEDLKTKLQLILAGEMPSKMEHAQCLMYGNCIRPEALTCMDCSYVIPKVYVLFSAELELKRLIDSIKNSSHPATRVRDTHLIFKILDLLKQAHKELGKEYVKTFIDTSTIKKKIEEIKPLMALDLQNKQKGE